MSELPQSDHKPPLMSDVRRYLDSTNKHQLSIAETRYEYLLQRRDQLFDKVRNGLLALNSASLLAVLTALGNPTVSSGKFGLSVNDLAAAACAFAVCLILACVGFWIETNRMQGEVATQFDRMLRHQNLRGMLDSTFTAEHDAQCHEAMKEVHKLPPKDFGHSKFEIIVTNTAGGIWIGGMAVLIMRVGALIHWLG
jgi:hypothetical protein